VTLQVPGSVYARGVFKRPPGETLLWVVAAEKDYVAVVPLGMYGTTPLSIPTEDFVAEYVRC